MVTQNGIRIMRRHDAVEVMRREGDWLKGQLDRRAAEGSLGALLDYRKRPQSGQHQLALRLSSHVAITTGRYHDRGIAALKRFS